MDSEALWASSKPPLPPSVVLYTVVAPAVSVVDAVVVAALALHQLNKKKDRPAASTFLVDLSEKDLFI